MSTRVHELAKKLGVKTQDLIERLRDMGLEVKLSPLAGLDDAVVERIEKMYASGPAPAAPGRPKAASPPPRARAAESTPPPRPTPPPAPTVTRPAPAPTRTPPPTLTSTNTPATASPRPSTSPTPTQAASSESPTPPMSEKSTATSTAPAPTPAPTHQAGGPLSSFTRPAGPRPAGPLAGHTPHRGAHVPGSSEGGAAPSGPLRRSDYISPSGVRGGSGSGRPANLGAAPRTQGPSGPSSEGPRRDSTSPQRSSGRPLPPVAPTPSSAPPSARRPEPPRPIGPQPGSMKPLQKFSVEEYKKFMSGGAAARPPGMPAPPNRVGTSLPGGSRPGAPPAGRGPLSPGGESPRPFTPATGDEDDRKGARPGAKGPGDRARGRVPDKKKPPERGAFVSTSAVPVKALLEQDDSGGGRRRFGRTGGGRRRNQRGGPAVIAPRKTEAVIQAPINVRTLSEAIGVKANQLVKRLWDTFGPSANINSALEDDAAMELAMEFGVELTVTNPQSAEDELFESHDQADQDEAARELRAPIITVLGHVDHGKTSLLDRIRRTDVVAGESGGITQHIGAYKIEHGGKMITFVDTPGHEAFTAMRARGANVTDMVVLVVAADDGVMPQTIEAIAHAKAADVPVVVALNKIDLPNAESTANITKIYSELAQQGLNPTEWGGDAEVIRTSTLTGRGIDDLLSTLETLAELLELKSNPNRPARGTCLESAISEGRGVVATVLVQDGTLRVGDAIVCGDGFGRVRALYDDQGRPIDEAPPSTPVEISGLDSVPPAGDSFHVVDDISTAREIADARRVRGRGATLVEHQPITLENIFTKMAEQKVKSLNLILKADVQGSIEALTKELEKLKNDEVPIRILLKAVGGISESDVSLAEASDAIIIGFRVAPEDRAMSAAEDKKIDIRRYDIIYQVTDEIKKAVEGMLIPDIKEVHLGRATVRHVFKISKVGTVAGCFVTQGTIERSSKARLIREGREIYKGSIDALKRFKEDVREVRENFECGIKISNYDDIKVDDTIEAYRIDIIRRTL